MPNKPVALVTGANQGIGLQIAKDLVPHGFTVLVGSRNFEKGQTAAKSIGVDARAVQLDVTDHKSIAAAAERIRKEFGRLDVLIQNAAISNMNKKPGQSVEEYSKTTRPSVVSLDEMREVVAETPELTGKPLERAKAALASRRAPQPFDRAAARIELDALITRAGTAGA